MRVLHVAPSIRKAYGGPTESLIGYITAAQTAGVDVSVAAPGCPAQEANAFAQRAGTTALHLFPSFGTAAFEVSPRLHSWLRSASESYDVVHVHGLFNTISSLAIRLCIRKNIPVVVRPFGTLSRYTFLHRRTMLKRAWLALLERKNVRRASALHFTTAIERSSAAWHGIAFNGRAFVIPPPFLPAEITPRVAGWEPNHPCVLFLGRVEPVKNIEALLDAWPGVLSAIGNARLTIAGAGDSAYESSLLERAKDLGIGETVTFAGFANASLKRQLLESASLFALPSKHENFGIVVIEALDAGLPVVVSPDVQLAPFIESNRLGLVSSTEPDRLATAIVSGLRDGQLRERVRVDAPAALSANFSPEAVGQLLLQMYQAAIRSKDKPAD